MTANVCSIKVVDQEFALIINYQNKFIYADTTMAVPETNPTETLITPTDKPSTMLPQKLTINSGYRHKLVVILVQKSYTQSH